MVSGFMWDGKPGWFEKRCAALHVLRAMRIKAAVMHWAWPVPTIQARMHACTHVCMHQHLLFPEACPRASM
jgi:hypothetical protein